MYLHIPALETVLLLNSRKDGIGGHTNILYQGWSFSDDCSERRGQLVPGAGAAADSPDQEGKVGDKGQVRSFPIG